MVNYDIVIPITFNNPNVTYKILEPGTYNIHFTTDVSVDVTNEVAFSLLSKAAVYAIKNELFIEDAE